MNNVVLLIAFGLVCIITIFIYVRLIRPKLYPKTKNDAKEQNTDILETAPIPIPEPILYQESEEQRILREEQEKHDRFADNLVNNSEMPPKINHFH